jgi:hypothetical protein
MKLLHWLAGPGYPLTIFVVGAAWCRILIWWDRRIPQHRPSLAWRKARRAFRRTDVSRAYPHPAPLTPAGGESPEDEAVETPPAHRLVHATPEQPPAGVACTRPQSPVDAVARTQLLRSPDSSSPPSP